MKSSCIKHPEKRSLVMLRQEFLEICEGSLAAAILLGVFEYWTNVKLAENKQRSTENESRKSHGKEPLEIHTWIYKSHNDLLTDTMGLLKEYEVRDGLKFLLDKNFLKKRNNPLYKWDKRLQYELQADIVNESIDHPQPFDSLPV